MEKKDPSDLPSLDLTEEQYEAAQSLKDSDNPLSPIATLLYQMDTRSDVDFEQPDKE